MNKNLPTMYKANIEYSPISVMLKGLALYSKMCP